MRASAPPRGPAARLTRAALFAFGALGSSAVAAVAAAGCSSSSTETIYPPYGIAPIPDGGDDFDATAVPPGDAGDAAVVGVDAGYGAFRINDDDAAADGGTDASNTALDSSTDSSHD